jgi:hypothetical protein
MLENHPIASAWAIVGAVALLMLGLSFILAALMDWGPNNDSEDEWKKRETKYIVQHFKKQNKKVGRFWKP